MEQRRSDGRVVLARFNTWSDVEHLLAGVELSPPTPDDVSRMKLDGPPATKAEIAAAFGVAPDSAAGRD
jgi:hypothetical protein